MSRITEFYRISPAAPAREQDAYLKQQEEAVKRDHNKLGRELEYFTAACACRHSSPQRSDTASTTSAAPVSTS